MLDVRSTPAVAVGVLITFTRETASDQQNSRPTGVVGRYPETLCVKTRCYLSLLGVVTGHSVKDVLWAIMKGFILEFIRF